MVNNLYLAVFVNENTWKTSITNQRGSTRVYLKNSYV